MEQQPLSYEELCLHLAADGAASYRILARCENEQESGAFAPPTEYLRPSATDGAPRRDIHSAASQDAFGEPADSLPFTASTAAETGARLFRALLPDRVRDLFQRAIGRTEKRSRIGLRLRIELDYHDARVAWLARLPWELLFWAEDHRFLALSRTSPVVRGGMVSHPARALALSGPLDILAVAASHHRGPAAGNGARGRRREPPRPREPPAGKLLRPPRCHLPAQSGSAAGDDRRRGRLPWHRRRDPQNYQRRELAQLRDRRRAAGRRHRRDGEDRRAIGRHQSRRTEGGRAGPGRGDRNPAKPGPGASTPRRGTAPGARDYRPCLVGGGGDRGRRGHSLDDALMSR